MSKPSTQPSLAWTGERMIPGHCDAATEMFHYQRYLYFRPWYSERKVIDAASGEGYGTNYASLWAAEALGFDISSEAVRHASARYSAPQYSQKDVCEVDYSNADLVVSFETIEHLPDPTLFLKALAKCKGAIVISTPNRNIVSPGNKLKDKPLNEHHTVEWSPDEFSELIQSHFPGRQVRFLSQKMQWPGIPVEGLDETAMFMIAIVDGWELPHWPKLGISMPTRSAERATTAVTQLSKVYPGEMTFAVVSNGCDPANLQALKAFQEANPHLLSIIENEENKGYGMGANAGLSALSTMGGFDMYGVTNDDVIPAVDCICEMVSAYRELDTLGHRPGMIGPVSNSVNGAQQVSIGNYTDMDTLVRASEAYQREHHDSADSAIQVRGLFFLMSNEVFQKVGGFDPRFGIGNFEDDDLNLRVRAAGYTLWIAKGAFLHHEGSKTFKELGVDYSLNIQRNLQLICEKWGVLDFSELIQFGGCIPGDQVYQSLEEEPKSSGLNFAMNGENVDVIHQASDIEFVSWLMQEIGGMPRETRYKIIEAIGRQAA